MSVCVGGLLDGRRAPPLAGRQRVPRAAPAAPARHPRRDEVADRGSLVPRPAPSAQVSGHGAASVARPRVLLLGLRGALRVNAPVAPRGSPRALGRSRCPACVCRQPKDSRLLPQTLPAQDCAQADGEGDPGPAAPFSAARRRGRCSGQPPEGGGGGRERERVAEVKHTFSVRVAMSKSSTHRRCPFGGAPAALPLLLRDGLPRRAPVHLPGGDARQSRHPDTGSSVSVHPKLPSTRQGVSAPGQGLCSWAPGPSAGAPSAARSRPRAGAPAR